MRRLKKLMVRTNALAQKSVLYKCFELSRLNQIILHLVGMGQVRLDQIKSDQIRTD